MATEAEVKAGIVAIDDKMRELIAEIVPEHLAFLPARSMALDKFNSAAGQAKVVEGVRKVLEAAEKVRAGG